MNSMESIYEEYTCDANQHIKFKLIRNIDDIENNNTIIYPEFTHQFYGENEKIFGYKNLNINFYFSAARLIPYVHISFDEKIENSKDFPADDFEHNLLNQLPQVERNLESFKHNIDNDNFLCFGKAIDQYKISDEVFEIYHATGSDLESQDFKTFNDRLQYFLLFFVDGSSFIDISDSCWEYLIIYQKYKDCNQSYKYATIGFMTVFNFFAYPDNIRQRISQVFVFPPFQKQGHGERLLDNFYNLAIANSAVKDVTVEDASDQFQTLRDYVDCKNALAVAEFNGELVKRGLYKKFVNLLKTKLKISTQQALRVYEILGLKLVSKSNVIEGMKYKQSVIKRLTDIFGKTKDFANQSHKGMNNENKSILIEKEYEKLEQCYSAVIRKLERGL